MKKFEFTLPQMILIVMSLLVVAFIDFYLGAKLGPQLFWGIELGDAKNADLLPDKLTEEQLNALLNDEGEVAVTFHQELENKTDSAMNVDQEVPKPSVDVVQKPILPPKVAIKVKTKSTTKPAPIPSPFKPKDLGEGQGEGEEPRFTLKVGSFSSYKQAQALALKFQQKGFSTHIETVQIPDKGNWYRVHVGRYPTQAAATAQKAQIERTTGIMPVIVSL